MTARSTGMRAGVYRGRDDLRCEEIPRPEILDGEVLVAIDACGVCPTDIKKVATGRDTPPRIYGHEMAGVVAATRASRWREGERVVVYHHAPCRACGFCRRREYAQCPVFKRTGTTAGFEPAGGGLAEYVRCMPAIAQAGIVRIPAGVPAEEAALMEPVNTCLKALRKIPDGAGNAPPTLWIAGFGSIGLIFLRLAVVRGFRVFGADPMPERRALAARLGAASVWAPDDPDAAGTMRALPEGGPDAAVVTAPVAQAVAQAVEIVRPCGTVIPFGHTQMDQRIEANAGHVGVLEKRLLGSYSSDPDLQEEVASLVAGGALRLGEMITHRLPLERCADAFALAAHPRPDALKVVVRPRDGA